MANMSPAVARIGFDLFRLASFQLSRDELAAQLRELGYFDELSPRMFKHYRALAAAGYDHYVSINRFDTARAAEPFEDELASNRYSYTVANVPAQITLVRDGNALTVLGRTERVSEAGALVRIADEQAIAGLSNVKPRAGEYARLDFVGADVSTHGRLATDLELDRGEALLDIEFNRLRSVTEFAGGTAMRGARVQLRLPAEDGGPVPADVLARRIYYLFDALEITRSLVNEVMTTESPSLEVAQPLRIDRLSMDSPLTVIIVGAPVVVTVLTGAWALLRGAEKVQDIRKKDAEIDRVRAETERTKAETDRTKAESERLNDQNQTAHLLHNLVRQQLREQGEELGSIPGPSLRFQNLADKQISASLEGLIRQDVLDVVIDEVEYGDSDQ